MSTAVLIIIILFCLLAVVTFALFLRAAKKYLDNETKKETAKGAEKKKKPVSDNSDAANYRTIAEGPNKKEETAEEPAKKAETPEEKVESAVVIEDNSEEEIEEVTTDETEEKEADIQSEETEEVEEVASDVEVETVENSVDEEKDEEVDDADDEDDDADENEDDDADEEIVIAGATDDAFSKIRARKSFMARLTLAPDKTKEYYNDLKKAFLSYKKVSSRISWAYDSINFGRTKLATFNIKGKTLYLYFALDANKYEGTKYAVEGVETKKYSSTPCLYKIKTDRRAKWALDLINDIANENGLASGTECTDNFIPEALTVEQLIEKGLIKLNN